MLHRADRLKRYIQAPLSLNVLTEDESISLQSYPLLEDCNLGTSLSDNFPWTENGENAMLTALLIILGSICEGCVLLAGSSASGDTSCG